MYNKCLRLALAGLILLGDAVPALAVEKAFQFFEEEALENVKVSIATKRDTALRETPGIVSVITKDEILNSGARDLKEVLTLLVPGFSFGTDVEGAVGAIVRGIWAFEGKFLLLIDGLEMNERLFGTVLFGNHYPLDSIEKIEIIRGPGSVIYGGFAELAVINVITKGAQQNAVYMAVNDSEMSHTYSHRGAALGYGKTYGDFYSSLNAAVSYGNRSQAVLTDFNGNQASLRGNSELNVSNANFNMGYKGLSFRTFIDKYNVYHIDNVGAIYTGPRPLRDDFGSYIYELKYDQKVGDTLTLVPRLEYKVDYPWITEQNDLLYTNHKHAERKTAGLNSFWDITSGINLLSGFEFSRSQLFRFDNSGPYEETFRNGTNELNFDNYAGFAQFVLHSDIANLTLGSRYDYVKEFGSAFVPRAALTKAIDRFHFKLMASQSFRSPVGILSNRSQVGDTLRPEKATNYELELGYKLTPTMWWVVNGFHITIDEPLVYSVNPTTLVGSYDNYGKIGTRGVESEFKVRERWFDLTANYAFYYVATNNVTLYRPQDPTGVPIHTDYLIGAPAHRVNGIIGLKFNPNVSLHPSIIYYSKRYVYLQNGAGIQAAPQVAIYNTNLRIRDVPLKGLELDLGVNDIFDQRLDTVPGYASNHSTLPGPARAFVAKLGYTYKF